MSGECREIEDYIATITKFVDGEITACQFEESYITLFKNEEKMFAQEVFETLHLLFTDVDAYCSDSELREEENLDDVELLHCAELALERLS